MFTRATILMSLLGLSWQHALCGTPTMLATQPGGDLSVADYLVSEKLDGIRARWDGHQLRSRYDNPFHPPDWFIAALPDVVIDGELWIDRGRFQDTVSIVRDTVADDAGWREIQFMAFDLPNHPGPFSQRTLALETIVNAIGAPWVKAVEQRRLQTRIDLNQWLMEVEAKEGEGLMLHHQDNLYKEGRANGLIKYKSHDDAEATVTGYTAGKGKYEGLVGALKVVTSEGIEFKIGSGLSDADRRAPPSIGTLITYRYRGFTKAGKPRFATYLRVRSDMETQKPN